MAQASYYIVYLECRPRVLLEDLEKKMNLANDWFRIQGDLWILHSTRNEETWYERLSPLIGVDGSLFICRLSEHDRQGWMPEDFWSWLERERK